MADSSALRVRRSRLHKRGDHSLCLPGRCRDSAQPAEVSQPPVPSAPPERSVEGFGEVGRRLWAEMTAAGPPGPLQRVLLVEACRIADRLAKLDRQLSGEDWLRFKVNEDATEVTVTIDNALSEARQQVTALKGIVAELRQGGAKTSNTTAKGASGIADLSARIAARRASPAG